ncbi:DNA internalization-related competence protein ComEC/Rec2 [Desulfosarcina cetonica]
MPAAPYGRPAVPVILALMAGILLGVHLPMVPTAALAALLPMLAWMIIRLRRFQPSRWSPLGAVLLSGYLSMAPWLAPIDRPDHVTHYLDSGYWRIQATVTEAASVRFGRTRTIVAVHALSRGKAIHAVHGRIRLTIMGTVPLAPGDRIRFPAKLRAFRNFRNPGGFDYRRYMAFEGIHGSAWVPADKLFREAGRTASPAGRLRAAACRYLGRLIDTAAAGAPPEAGAVLKALVFGDRTAIDEDLRERFNRSGVGHLLAISGLHVGIVASVAFFGLGWLFTRFPALLWRGWSRRWAAVGTLVPVLAYGVLAGMTPSTQRAVIMVGLFLTAVVIGRRHDILNTLALAALIILIIFPPSIFTISFQLSFAAVLSIAYGFRKIVPVRAPAGTWRQRTVRWLTDFLLVSALAVAGTTPIVLAHFNQTSLVGLAANLVLVPLIGFVAVPAGLLSAVLAAISEPLAILGFGLAINVLQLGLMGVEWFAGLAFAAVKTVTPSFVEMALYYIAGWTLLNLRQWRAAPWVLAGVLVLGIVDGGYWAFVRYWHGDLRVMAIDVGQGSATLLEMPGGRVMLVDGGGFADHRLFDMGRRVIAPLLWRKKIARVDTLVLSHPNADHLNGLIYIARHFKVRELWTNGDVNTTLGYETLMAACREHDIRVRRMDASADAVMVGGVRLAILNPPAGFFASPDDLDQADRNGASLVLKATFGAVGFLIPGDISGAAEQAMVRRTAPADLRSTVIFAPHHGSRTSSSKALVDAVDPQLVVISAGAGNRYGFPHPEVMNRYGRAGCRPLCTCNQGAVIMRSDGGTLNVQCPMTHVTWEAPVR